MLPRSHFLPAAVTAAAMLASPALAEDTRQVSEYNISLGLLPIATASFSSEFKGNNYKIAGSFKSSGIVNLFTRISADTNVAGAVMDKRLQTSKYSLVYTQGKKTRVYDVNYRNGNVVSTTIKPEPGTRPSSWVPVSPGDLRSVMDPLSGLIFPEGAQVCSGRMPIYDGESRLDLVMSSKGSKPFSTDGFKGDAIVCEIRYEPKSGYKKGRSDIEFLQKQRMEVWFAKAQTSNVYAPVYARIPTRVGDVYVTAVKYGG